MKLSVSDFPALFWKHHPDDEVSLVVNGEVVDILAVADLMKADVLDADERVRALRLEIQRSARGLTSKVDELAGVIEDMRNRLNAAEKRKVRA